MQVMVESSACQAHTFVQNKARVWTIDTLFRSGLLLAYFG